MAIPSTGDELISLFEDFLQDTLSTILAIIAVAANCFQDVCKA